MQVQLETGDSPLASGLAEKELDDQSHGLPRCRASVEAHVASALPHM